MDIVGRAGSARTMLHSVHTAGEGETWYDLEKSTEG